MMHQNCPYACTIVTHETNLFYALQKVLIYVKELTSHEELNSMYSFEQIC